MKELLTKRFWQDVKKTFDEAREGPFSEGSGPQIPTGQQSSERPPEPQSSPEGSAGSGGSTLSKSEHPIETA